MTAGARAELQAIPDEELSQYSGQAAVAFDVSEIAGTSYTRMTLGMEADVQMNIDTVELGAYAKNGESLAADIDISNIGLGSISKDSAAVQLDGRTYAVNEIIPFELNDPYFEVAQDEQTGDLIGFRLGFGEARGQLTGDFNSLSGNVGVDIKDAAGNEYRSTLLDVSGSADNSRSQFFGVDNTASGGQTDCSTGTLCYNLGDFKTFDIGQRDSATGDVDYTQDFFISFQKDALQWQGSDGVAIDAALGVFMNLPTATQIDMSSGLNALGTARTRTEYIDRGNDRF